MLKRIANTKGDGHALQKRASGVLQILREMGTLYKSAPVEISIEKLNQFECLTSGFTFS
jgi:hypothetical protein